MTRTGPGSARPQAQAPAQGFLRSRSGRGEGRLSERDERPSPPTLLQPSAHHKLGVEPNPLASRACACGIARPSSHRKFWGAPSPLPGAPSPLPSAPSPSPSRAVPVAGRAVPVAERAVPVAGRAVPVAERAIPVEPRRPRCRARRPRRRARHPCCRARGRRCAATGSTLDAARAVRGSMWSRHVVEAVQLSLGRGAEDLNSTPTAEAHELDGARHSGVGASIFEVRVSVSMPRRPCLDVRASKRMRAVTGGSARKTQQHGSRKSTSPKNVAPFELRARRRMRTARAISLGLARAGSQQADSGRSTSSRTSRHSRSVPR